MNRVFSAIGLRGLVLALALSTSALTVGCKQGEGDTCQIDNDCTSGLVCNPGTMQCQKPGAGTPDAAPASDARPNTDAEPGPDASAVDAQVPDAQPATIDANTTPDAEAPDATS